MVVLLNLILLMVEQQHLLLLECILTKLQVFQLVLLAVLIFPFTKYWGIAGTSLAVVLATFAPNIVAWHRATREVQGNFYFFIKLLVIPLINVCISILLTLSLRQFYAGTLNDLLSFMVQVVIFTLFYAGLVYVSEKLFNYGMFDILQNIKENLKKQKP